MINSLIGDIFPFCQISRMPVFFHWHWRAIWMVYGSYVLRFLFSKLQIFFFGIKSCSFGCFYGYLVQDMIWYLFEVVVVISSLFYSSGKIKKKKSGNPGKIRKVRKICATLIDSWNVDPCDKMSLKSHIKLHIKSHIESRIKSHIWSHKVRTNID